MVSKIVWNDAYSVGKTEIDENNKALIEMINNLIDNPDISVHSEMLHETLCKMMKYAQKLEEEERLLHECGYPQVSC